MENTNNSNDIRWYAGRIFHYVKQGRMPWKFQQIQNDLKLFLKLFPENPFRAIKFFQQFVNRKISDEGYILQVCGPKLLKDGLKACQLNGLKPFLIFGTLRGCVLLNDFLPLSEDIDLGFFDEDFNKKYLIKEVLLKKGYVCKVDDYCLLQIAHPKFLGLIIDFFRVYQNDDQMVISLFEHDRDLLVDLCRQYRPTDYVIIFEHPESWKILASLYFPLNAFLGFRTVHFKHLDVLIPDDPEKFLRFHYGEKWNNLREKAHFLIGRKNLTLEMIAPFK